MSCSEEQGGAHSEPRSQSSQFSIFNASYKPAHNREDRQTRLLQSCSQVPHGHGRASQWQATGQVLCALGCVDVCQCAAFLPGSTSPSNVLPHPTHLYQVPPGLSLHQGARQHQWGWWSTHPSVQAHTQAVAPDCISGPHSLATMCVHACAIPASKSTGSQTPEAHMKACCGRCCCSDSGSGPMVMGAH
jgi:hypothetical protein